VSESVRAFKPPTRHKNDDEQHLDLLDELNTEKTPDGHGNASASRSHQPKAISVK